MADILLTDLTNGSIIDDNGEYKWSGTGVFDRLIAAVNDNMAIQVKESRLPKDDFAVAYTQAITAVLNQATQFALQEKVVEADIAIREEQLKIAYVDRIIKDKEAAALGLDSAMKVAKELKEAATDEAPYIYAPQYEEVTSE